MRWLKKEKYLLLTDKNKDTFCPGHWDDIHFAPSQGYMYGCCKAVPIPIEDTRETDQRIHDSLNGIRNPACEYCWKTEDAGNESYRHYKIKLWNKTKSCRMLNLVLGNLCNLQCTYCNEKYSSKWQTDKKRNGEIKLHFDRNVYYGGESIDNKESQEYIDFFNSITPAPKVFSVSGGEPLMGNIFNDILTQCDLTDVETIRVSTNLNYPNRVVVKKLLEFENIFMEEVQK